MNRTALLLVAIVIVILGAIGGVVILNNNNSNSQNQNTENSSNSNSQSNTESTQETSMSTVDEACSIFTAQEISNAFGITVGEGDEYNPSKTSDQLPLVQCEWEQSEEEAGSFLDTYSFNLGVYNFATSERAQRELEDTKITGGGLSFEEIDGIADGAAFNRLSSVDASQAIIVWTKGNIYYRLGALRLSGIDQPTIEAKLKELVGSKF